LTVMQTRNRRKKPQQQDLQKGLDGLDLDK
jgi:hypothetical protein